MMVRSTRVVNQAHLWAVARAHREFTAPELSAATHLSIRYVKDSLRDWIRNGYAAEVGKRGAKKLFRVTEKAGDPGTGFGQRFGSTAEDRMWFAIRKAGGLICARDVAMWSNTDEVPVSLEAAHGYCRLLLAAGYLRCDVKADGKGAAAYYRLIRDTGPRAPIERRVRAVLDPNENRLRVAHR